MTRRTQIVVTASCALMLLGVWAHYPPLLLYGLVLNRIGHRNAPCGHGNAPPIDFLTQRHP